MRFKTILTLLIFLGCFFTVSPEIIVKQGSDGRIVVTNNPAVSFLSSARKGVSYSVSSYSTTQLPSIYGEKISKLSKKYNLREDLIIAVARAESGFNRFAKSKKGAVGIMQLMKDTAEHYGVTNRYDVDQNLEGGVKHLKYLYKKYNKNLKITLAAYNAGEDAVRKYNGVPPYKETLNYIRKVKKFMGLSYSTLFTKPGRTKIFKYETKDGRIVLSDTPPLNASKNVSIFE